VDNIDHHPSAGLPPAPNAAYPPAVSRSATIGLVVLVLVLGAWILLVGVISFLGLHVTSRRALAALIGVPVVVMVALAWLSLRRSLTPRSRPAVIAGPRAIAVALAPLVAIIAVSIATSGHDGIGPLSAAAVLWGVLVPLAAVYPGLAAFIAPRSRAETLVVGVAVAAPAFVLAIPLLMQPITSRFMGGRPDLWHEFILRASLPVFVLLATFLAIVVASAAMSRAGRPWVVAGGVMGAMTFGAGGLLSLLAWNLVM
jgi:hypothetical protein